MKRITALGLGLLVCLAACKKKETDDPTSTSGTTSTEDTLGRSITLYGVSQTNEGGSKPVNRIFRIQGDGTGFENLLTIDASAGEQSYGHLCKVNNNFYGMMVGGGAYNGGSIYKFTPATKTFKKLVDFNPAIDGFVGAYSSMVLASDGKIYGVNAAHIFRIDPNTDNFEVVFNQYTAGVTLGSYSSIIEGSGHFYITTFGEDFSANPTCNIIRFDAGSKTAEVIYSFQKSSGTEPLSPLCLASDQNFYGLTNKGGNADKGVFYKFNPSGKVYSKLLDFGAEKGEVFALGRGRVIECGSRLFGITYYGGTAGQGVFYSYVLSNATFKTEKLFDIEKDKFSWPTGIMLSKRNLIYLSGVGYNSAGALLRYNPSDSSYKTIYTFSKDNSKYAAIYSELIEF